MKKNGIRKAGKQEKAFSVWFSVSCVPVFLIRLSTINHQLTT